MRNVSRVKNYGRRLYTKTYYDITKFKMVSNASRRRLFSPIKVGDDVRILRDHKGRERTVWHVVFTSRKMCVLRSVRWWDDEVEYATKQKRTLRKYQRSAD